MSDMQYNDTGVSTPYSKVASSTEADKLPDEQKSALVFKAIEEHFGHSVDPIDVFGDGSGEDHLKKFRSLTDPSKNIDLYGEPLKTWVMSTPEEQDAIVNKAGFSLPKAPAPLEKARMEVQSESVGNTMLSASAPTKEADLVEIKAPENMDMSAAREAYGAKLRGEDRFIRLTSLETALDQHPAAKDVAYAWAKTGKIDVAKLMSYPENVRTGIMDLKSVYTGVDNDYSWYGRITKGTLNSVVKMGNSALMGLNVMDIPAGVIEGETVEKVRAEFRKNIMTGDPVPSVQQIMEKENPFWAQYRAYRKTTSEMASRADVSIAPFGKTLELDHYGTDGENVAEKIAYPVVDSIGYLLAPVVGPIGSAAMASSMYKDNQDHLIASGCNFDDSVAGSSMITLSQWMAMTGIGKVAHTGVTPYSINTALIPATYRSFMNKGVREGFKDGVEALKQGVPDVLRNTAKMYVMNVAMQLSAKYGNDMYIPGELEAADMGQQLVDTLKEQIYPSIGFGLIPSVSSNVRGMVNKPIVGSEFTSLFEQRRRSWEALNEVNNPLDVAPDKATQNLDRFVGELYDRWSSAPTDKSKASVLSLANLPNAEVVDGFFRRVDVEHKLRAETEGMFQFDEQGFADVFKNRPDVKIEMIDENSIDVEHSIIEGAAPVKVRFVRGEQHAPPRETILKEIESVEGRKFETKEEQDDAIRRRSARGFIRQSVTLDGPNGAKLPYDALIWLAGRNVEDNVVAGRDTVAHEFFHAGMDFLRKSDQITPEMDATLLKRYVKEDGSFDEEAAAQAYAAHILAPARGPLSETWEAIRRGFSRMVQAVTGRTIIEDRMTVDGFFNSLAEGKIKFNEKKTYTKTEEKPPVEEPTLPKDSVQDKDLVRSDEVGDDIRSPKDVEQAWYDQFLRDPEQEVGDDVRPAELASKFVWDGENKKRFQLAGFYSQLQRVIDKKMPNRMKAGDLRGMLDPNKGSGVKADEIYWSGLQDFLDSKQPGDMVTKEEVQAVTKPVDVQEVVLGGHKLKSIDPSPELVNHLTELNIPIPTDRNGWKKLYTDDWRKDITRKQALHKKYFGELYTLSYGHPYEKLDDVESTKTKFSGKNLRLPGKNKDYRELLLTLPTTGSDFASGHYFEPNVLTHMRFDTRTDAGGKKTLVIQEIQSDWHQKGREEGYKGDNSKLEAEYEELNKIPRDQRTPEQVDREEQLYSQLELGKGLGVVPDAPFKDTSKGWANLAMKRMVKWAVDNGFDQIAWTTGDQQAERYDLSKHLDSVRWDRIGNTTDLLIRAHNKSGVEVLKHTGPISSLPEIVGKDLAKKIEEASSDPTKSMGKFADLDLKVGGEGMRAFYDQILPSIAKGIGKKFGAEVGNTSLIAKFTAGKKEKVWHTVDGDGNVVTFDSKKDAKYHFNDLQERGEGSMFEGTREDGVTWRVERIEGGEVIEDKIPTKEAAEQYITDDLQDRIVRVDSSDLAPITVHSLPITDAMRKSVQEDGLPLFQLSRVQKMYLDTHLNPEKAHIEVANVASQWMDKNRSSMTRYVDRGFISISGDTIKLKTDEMHIDVARESTSQNTMHVLGNIIMGGIIRKANPGNYQFGKEPSEAQYTSLAKNLIRDGLDKKDYYFDIADTIRMKGDLPKNQVEADSIIEKLKNKYREARDELAGKSAGYVSPMAEFRDAGNKFQLSPDATAFQDRLKSLYEFDWDGKTVYRAIPKGGSQLGHSIFFSVDKENANTYADMDGYKKTKKFVLGKGLGKSFDLDLDNTVAMAHIEKSAKSTLDKEGDVAILIEKALPGLREEGYDSLLITGETGPEVYGTPAEVVILNPELLPGPKGIQFQLSNRTSKEALTRAVGARLLKGTPPDRAEIESIIKSLKIKSTVDEIVLDAIDAASKVQSVIDSKSSDPVILKALDKAVLKKKYTSNVFAGVRTGERVGKDVASYDAIKRKAADAAAKDVITAAKGMPSTTDKVFFEDTLPRLAGSPTNFFNALKDKVGEFARNKYDLVVDEYNDPRTVRELALTARRTVDALARKLAGGRGREFVRLATRDFIAIKDMNALQSAVEGALDRLNETRIKTSKEKLIEEFELLLKTTGGAKGRVKQNTPIYKAKIEPLYQEWSRMVKSAIRMSADAVEKRVSEIEAEAVSGKLYEDTTADTIKKQMEWAVLTEFGNLKDAELGEIADAFDKAMIALEGSKERHIERVSTMVDRWKNISSQLASQFVPSGPKPESSTIKSFILGQRPSLINNIKSAFNGKDTKTQAELLEHFDFLIGTSQHRYEWEVAEQTREHQNAMEKIYGVKWRKAWGEMLKPRPEWNHLNRGGQDTVWTKDRVMNMLAEVSQDTYAKNVEKHGRDGTYIDELVKVLSPSDLKMVEWYKDWAEKNRQSLSDVSEQVFGMPIHSPDPNYWRATIYLEKGGIEERHQSWSPFLKSLTWRQKHERDFDQEQGMGQTFRQQMMENARWKAWVEAGMEITHTLGNKKVQEAIRKTRGDDELKQLRSQLLDVMTDRGSPESLGKSGKVINQVRAYATLAVLAWDPARYPKQISGFPSWGNEIGMSGVIKHFTSLLTPEGRADFAKIWNSPEMQLWRGAGAADENMQNAMREETGGAFIRFLQKGMRTSADSSAIANAMMAQGVYRELRAKYTDAMGPGREKEADQKALTMTFQIGRRADMSGRVENQNVIQRSGSGGKFITWLAGPGYGFLGYEVDAIRAVMDKKEGSGKQLTKTLVLNHVILPALYQSAGAMVSAILGKDLEDEKYRKSLENRMVFAMLSGPWAYLSVLASTGQDFFDTMAGGVIYDNNGPVGVLGTSAALAGKSTRDAYLAAIGESEWETVAKDIDRLLRSLNPLYRDVSMIQENYELELP